MWQEYNEKVFIVHISSILDGWCAGGCGLTLTMVSSASKRGNQFQWKLWSLNDLMGPKRL
jgi:hypothetical protein